MELGIFAKTFGRSSIEAVFDAIREHGLSKTQFNMSCAGLPAMPDAIRTRVGPQHWARKQTAGRGAIGRLGHLQYGASG
ncbi:hypothetical protein [Paenibacillus silvisoli]|uniref:hypothetical protein n=1 Tax=Paenibacillus silvisoli TaxID=3110539 RepID=UPI0028042771|nr:hypothetical protein [Paenibacillus silvisoli]